MQGGGGLEPQAAEAPSPPSSSWASLLGPLQRLCCARAGEAGDAHDLVDSTIVPSRLHFGEEETISAASSFSFSTSPSGAHDQLVERREVPLEDGARYRGQWRGHHRHGRGRLVKPSGDSYEGSFERSHAHGHGVWRTTDGGSYEGQWERDLKHGYGKYLHKDGTEYEGEWQVDHKSGRGCERWADGASYAGEFFNGHKHGVGIYTGHDKQDREWRYEGQWADDQIDGEGCYTFGDGRTYYGQWEAGLMSGVGRMDFPDGSCYEGGYEHGVRHGEGVFTNGAGVVIKGQWLRGKMEGDRGKAAAAASRRGAPASSWNSLGTLARGGA